MINAPELIPTVKTFGFIGRCPAKGCKCVFRMETPGKVETKYTRGFPGVPGSAEKYTVTVPAYSPYVYYLHCAVHRWELRWKRVEGTFNPEHKCDARCINATGHNCECSCGGANHGAAYSL